MELQEDSLVTKAKGEEMETKKKLVIFILISLICSLYLIEIFISSLIYTNSINLNTINQQIDLYKHKNNQLYLELLQKESYTLIASEAATEGFRPAPFITP